jgi:hypothetical protein
VEDFDPTGVCRDVAKAILVIDEQVHGQQIDCWTEQLHLPGTGELSE